MSLARIDAALGGGFRRMLRWLAGWWRPTPESIRATKEDLLLYRVVTENVSDVIVRLDHRHRRTYVSPSCEEVLGYTPEEMLGGGAFELVHPDDLPAVLALFTAFGPEHPVQEASWRIRRKDSSYIWVEARYRYLKDDGGLVVILRDVNQRKVAEERLAEAIKRLEYLAMQDGLTGLPNRHHILEALTKRLATNDNTAVFFVDLDGFKPVNDLHGHDVGDAVLATVAARLTHALGEDALVGRLGGDEFAVLLEARRDAETAERAVRVVEAISQPIAANGITVNVTASIGIAVSPRDGTSVSDILRNADTAMYYAKRTSSGHFKFFGAWMDPSSRKAAHRRRTFRGHRDADADHLKTGLRQDQALAAHNFQDPLLHH